MGMIWEAYGKGVPLLRVPGKIPNSNEGINQQRNSQIFRSTCSDQRKDQSVRPIKLRTFETPKLTVVGDMEVTGDFSFAFTKPIETTILKWLFQVPCIYIYISMWEFVNLNLGDPDFIQAILWGID